VAEAAGFGLNGSGRPAFLASVLQRAPWIAAVLACAALAMSAAAAPAKKNPSWSELTAAQQQILAPLASEWNGLDAGDKRTWLGVAKRFPKMTPIGQKRVHTRMKKWAKLTPEQRREARDRYRKLTPQKRRELEREWAKYQALPPEERARLEAPPAPPSVTRARAAKAPAAPAPDAK
jgi:hypothetical protein